MIKCEVRAISSKPSLQFGASPRASEAADELEKLSSNFTKRRFIDYKISWLAYFNSTRPSEEPELSFPQSKRRFKFGWTTQQVTAGSYWLEISPAEKINSRETFSSRWRLTRTLFKLRVIDLRGLFYALLAECNILCMCMDVRMCVYVYMIKYHPVVGQHLSFQLLRFRLRRS